MILNGIWFAISFSLPTGHEVRLVLAVGYGTDENQNVKKIRKSQEEIVSFNHW